MIAPNTPDDDFETTTTAEDAAAAESVVDETGLLYRTVYSTCYGLGFGVSLPLLFASQVFPWDSALGRGLQDGASAAFGRSEAARQRMAAAAERVKIKAGDAYAGVAQRVQERVEAVQDAIAERRYRRRRA